jgi:hypothetical protein
MDRSIDKASWDAGAGNGSSGEDGARQEPFVRAGGADEPFEVEVDIKRRYLRLVVRGEWDDADFDAYADAYRRAVATLMAHGGIRYVLTDASEYGLLSPELAAKTAALARSVEQASTERGAIVTASIINQAQSRDICSERGIRYFRKVNQALTWLFSDEA